MRWQALVAVLFTLLCFSIGALVVQHRDRVSSWSSVSVEYLHDSTGDLAAVEAKAQLLQDQVTRLEAQLIEPSTGADSLAGNPAPLFLRSEDVGINHITIPGSISDGNKSEAVNLHCFLRAISEADGSVRIRGYGFAESVERLVTHYQNMMVKAPGVFQHWVDPRIFLKPLVVNATDRNFMLRIDEAQQQPWRAFDLELALSADEVAADGGYYDFRIGEWHRYARVPLLDWVAAGQFDPGFAPPVTVGSGGSSGAALSTALSTTQYIFVLKPFYKIPADLAVSLLVNHMAYHRAIGFSGHLVYCRQNSIFHYFLQDPTIQRYVQEGYLRLILFQDPVAYFANKRRSGAVHQVSVCKLGEQEHTWRGRRIHLMTRLRIMCRCDRVANHLDNRVAKC